MVSDGVGSVRDILYSSERAILPHPWDRDHAPLPNEHADFQPAKTFEPSSGASVLHDAVHLFVMQKIDIFPCAW